jgi:hypothetical protein
LSPTSGVTDTGERRARKLACGVRRGADGKGSHQRDLAGGLPYFVVFCESREDAETALGVLKDWLAKRGLTLCEEKTRSVHLTEGFDFLGFTVRHYPDARTGQEPGTSCVSRQARNRSRGCGSPCGPSGVGSTERTSKRFSRA